MKFAKELNEELVPEWRVKYLDYRTGKKKIKAIRRALAKFNASPSQTRPKNDRTPADLLRRGSASWLLTLTGAAGRPGAPSPPLDESMSQPFWTQIDPTIAEHRDLQNRLRQADPRQTNNDRPHRKPSERTDRAGGHGEHDGGDDDGGEESEPETELEPEPEPEPESERIPNPETERQPLRSRSAHATDGRFSEPNYGSILSSAVSKPSAGGAPSLHLPDPALPPPSDGLPSRYDARGQIPFPTVRRASSATGDAYEVGKTNVPHHPPKLAAALMHRPHFPHAPKRTATAPTGGVKPSRRPLVNRIFQSQRNNGGARSDVPLQSYKEFDQRQTEFFQFLDKELEKIETFYKMKEDEAVERLESLRNQLHIMRDRRVHELLASKKQKDLGNGNQFPAHAGSYGGAPPRKGSFPVLDWIKPVENAIGIGRFGKNSKALGMMGMSPAQHFSEAANARDQDQYRDFTRRSFHDDVPYRVAKRKLKLALQEYYRGLELLKAYVLLNRTAFRKINKKYDKAVQARPPLKYMSEKVSKSWFVQSERLEGLLVAVEDLYARYFERGNRKVAVGKLRSKPGGNNFSASVFRNGVFLTAGVILTAEALVDSQIYLNDKDPVIATQTDYLLQLYGGYFLALLLFLLFTVICRLWTRAKINYTFIFEFDTRHTLDWRQLAELPCGFAFLFGLIMWLNFQGFEPELFLWWPTILIGITLTIIFFPAKLIYHRSRAWFLYSQWRLLLAGLYPVEFRDFFLGDMFCSLTYTMQNVEVFFCLIISSWDDPDMCNSSNSRLLGFFSTLPGIWRAFQCIRRYYDTRNAFPHLVNCGKYIFTIMFYMTLSLYRIDDNVEYKTIFVVIGIINSLYTSTWDILMDWSLCNPYAEHKFLRDDLGYKQVWPYYLAMFIDPIIRFNWILYVVVPDELQHSALLSFMISCSEIMRRAMWTVFRVENEHCTNVGRFRASRDIPLPYGEIDVPASERTSILHEGDEEASSETMTESAVPPHHIASQLKGTPSPKIPQRPSSTRHPSHRHDNANNVDLEAATGTTSGFSRPQPSRRPTFQQGNTHDSPTLTTSGKLSRVGTMIHNAHAQDFERRRRPGTSPTISGGRQHHQNSSDEDDDDEDDDEVEELEQQELDNAAEREIERERERRDKSTRATSKRNSFVGTVASVVGSPRSPMFPHRDRERDGRSRSHTVGSFAGGAGGALSGAPSIVGVGASSSSNNNNNRAGRSWLKIGVEEESTVGSEGPRD